MKEQIHTSLLRATLAAVIAVTAGCTGTSGGPQPDHTTVEGQDRITVEGQDPRILLHDGSGPAMQALLTGELTYSASTKCLTVRRAQQAERPVVLLWPPGTRPVSQEDKRGVRLPDNGSPLLEGAAVRIVGGFVDWKAHPPAGLKVPDACVADPASADIFEVSPVDPVG
ncbi:hypothetical protein [Nonomuraea lactucae]|uniref:hypothetical protein n=1 Tax=Nonomuraea lactucae TaxID=2249762 RepID=UPI0013B3732B|nr:hypothetical protein [Nonomuraea lactucae]